MIKIWQISWLLDNCVQEDDALKTFEAVEASCVLHQYCSQDFLQVTFLSGWERSRPSSCFTFSSRDRPMLSTRTSIATSSFQRPYRSAITIVFAHDQALDDHTWAGDTTAMMHPSRQAYVEEDHPQVSSRIQYAPRLDQQMFMRSTEPRPVWRPSFVWVERRGRRERLMETGAVGRTCIRILT